MRVRPARTGLQMATAIDDGESSLAKREKGAQDLGFPWKLHRKKEEGTVISPRHLAQTETMCGSERRATDALCSSARSRRGVAS